MIAVDALLVVAMDDEAAPFRQLARTTGPVTTTGGAAHQLLTIDDRTVVLLRSGIGLVNAAAATARALTWARPAVVVNAGTAGGLGVDVRVGDVVVADQTLYATADATDFGYVLGQIPGMPARFDCDPRLAAAAAAAGTPQIPTRRGLAVAADAFVTARIVDKVREQFPDALSTDMESTAVHQVAAAAGIPFVSIRGISDLCGPAADADHATHVDDAAQRSATVVRALLSTLD